MNNNDNNKTISSAFEEIIPADGAKERMLANIKRKAETRKPNPISVKPAKWAAPLAACLVVAVITAVGSKLIPPLSQTQTPSESTQIGNHIRVVDTADTLAKELGISVDAPEGSENVQYRIIDDEIADISFVYRDIDYTLRASEKNGDFSGINGSAVLSKLIEDNDAVLTMVKNSSDEAFLKLEWNAGKTRYFLCCPDNEANGNSPNIRNSDPGIYSHTEAEDTIIELYGLIS